MRRAYCLMDCSRSLEVRVEKRGDKYVWELHREGIAQPVKFSAPVYLSEAAARTSGDEVRKTIWLDWLPERRREHR